MTLEELETALSEARDRLDDAIAARKAANEAEETARKEWQTALEAVKLAEWWVGKTRVGEWAVVKVMPKTVELARPHVDGLYVYTQPTRVYRATGKTSRTWGRPLVDPAELEQVIGGMA